MIMSVWRRNEDEMFPFFLPDCQNDRILQEWPLIEVDKFRSCMLFSWNGHGFWMKYTVQGTISEDRFLRQLICLEILLVIKKCKSPDKSMFQNELHYKWC